MTGPAEVLLDLLFPPKCVFCRKLLRKGEAGFCARCQERLPWCLGSDAEQHLEFISLCASPLWYQDEVRESFHRYKFKGSRGYAGSYGRLMAQCVRDHLAGRYDLITWVPLSERRLRSRGYDQAMLLAEAAALELGDVAAETLTKVRDTDAQSGLGGDDGARRELQAQDVGYVLSTPTVPEFLTAREFLKFFLEINEGKIRSPQPLDVYFDRMNIAPEDRDKLLKDYSHGMKNKMQMLVNLIAEPTLFLLDEPLTSLDVVVAEEMKALLRHQKAGRVTIFSTHLMDLALDLCDEIVLLSHGVLSRVDKANLDEEGFKEKIIAALQAEEPQGAQEAGHE